MNLLILYNRLLKLNEKRKIEHRISKGFSIIISYFDDDDKNTVISILGKMYTISGWLSTILVLVLPIAVSNYITSDIYIHIIVMMIIILLKYDLKQVSQIIRNTTYLYRTCTLNYKKLYMFFYLKYLFFEVVLKILVPYVIGYFLYLNKMSINITNQISLLMIFSLLVLIAAYLYPTYLYKSNSEYRGRSLLEKFEKQYKDEHLKQLSDKLDFKYIAKRYMSIGRVNLKVNIIIAVIISIVALGIYLFASKSVINSKIIVLIYISINPLIIYLLASMFVLPNLVSVDYVRTTNYFVKKYRIITELVNEVFFTLVQSIRYFLFIFIIQMLLYIVVYNDNYSVLLIVLCIIHCTLILFLLVLRIHSIYLIKYEDASIDSNDFSVLRIIEDYVMLGLPFIALGPMIVYLQKEDNLLMTLCLYATFVFIILIYTKIRHRYISKGEKNVRS